MRTLIIILFLAIFANAQKVEQINFKKASNKALLFSFSGLSNLNANTFNQGVGAKIYLNENSAFYAGLQLNYQKTTTPANPDTNENAYDGQNTSFNLGINAGFEWHTLTAKRVSPYIGGGVMFSFGSSKQFDPNKWNKTNTGPIYRQIYETTGIFTFEIFGTGGVEFFITKEISLAAEYHLGYSYLSNGEDKVSYELVQGEDIYHPKGHSYKKSSVSKFGFSTNGSLTLAIYF